MKTSLLLFFSVLPFLTFAQFNKGQVYLGGSISASSSNSTRGPQKSNSFSVSPSFGYFITPRLAAGGSIGYSHSYNEQDFYSGGFDANGNFTKYLGFSKVNSNSIIINSFIRYYIPLSHSFYFAAHGQINFSRGTDNYSNSNGTDLDVQSQKIPSYTFGPTIKPVFIFFPSPRWGVEASVGSISYSHTRNLPNASSSDTLVLSAGSFSFGLAYYFNRATE